MNPSLSIGPSFRFAYIFMGFERFRTKINKNMDRRIIGEDCFLVAHCFCCDAIKFIGSIRLPRKNLWQSKCFFSLLPQEVNPIGHILLPESNRASKKFPCVCVVNKGNCPRKWKNNITDVHGIARKLFFYYFPREKLASSKLGEISNFHRSGIFLWTQWQMAWACSWV